jgi:hypothetical protein
MHVETNTYALTFDQVDSCGAEIKFPYMENFTMARFALYVREMTPIPAIR